MFVFTSIGNLGQGCLNLYMKRFCVYELVNKGFEVERQAAIPVIWKELKMEMGFRADLMINNKVIIEVKSVEQIAPVHKKQVLTYLRLTKLKLGLLINFNEALMKDGITRVVNNL